MKFVRDDAVGSRWAFATLLVTIPTVLVIAVANGDAPLWFFLGGAALFVVVALVAFVFGPRWQGR